MSDGIWRGNRVTVLSKGVKTAVIITPLSIKMEISIHEIRTASARVGSKYRPPDATKLR